MWRCSGTGREDVVNEVIVPVVSNSTCRQRAWYGRRIKTDMVCAGYEVGGRDSCTGDSGGPLLRQPGFKKQWQVVGVTSWGILCGLRRKPGVYTRVYPYLDWVNQRIKGTYNSLSCIRPSSGTHPKHSLQYIGADRCDRL